MVARTVLAEANATASIAATAAATRAIKEGSIRCLPILPVQTP